MPRAQTFTCSASLPFDSLKTTIDKAKTSERFHLGIGAAGDQTLLSIPFTKHPPQPPHVNELQIDTLYASGTAAVTMDVAQIYGDLNSYAQSAATHNPGVTLFAELKAISQAGQAHTEIRFGITITQTPSISCAWNDAPLDIIVRLFQSAIGSEGQHSIQRSNDQIQYSGDYGDKQSSGSALIGYNFSIPVKDSEKLASRMKAIAADCGLEFTEWRWLVDFIFNRKMNPQDYLSSWKLISERISFITDGSFDIDFSLNSLEGLEWVRANLGGKRTYSVCLGYFDWNTSARADLIVKVSKGGYTLRLQCHADSEQILDSVNHLLGLDFQAR